ncbi:MAG: chloride channel protein [Pseudomonadota bacterium]
MTVIKKSLRRSRFRLLVWRWRVMLWVGALTVGLAAILFAEAALRADHLFRWLAGVHPLVPFVVTPAGFAAVVWVTRRFFPGSEGSGIPQTIAALQLPQIAQRRSVMSVRIAAAKIALTSLALASGASVGREGPTVQSGAALMHTLGRIVRLPQGHIDRTLILAGGAAGIAAAFNTPLAGIVFAIEELSRSFEERTSGTVLTAVIVAGLTSMALVGNYTYFGHSTATLPFADIWKVVLVCGVAGGLLGGGFARILITFAAGLPGRVGALAKAHPIRLAALCGLGIAVLGALSDNTIYGTGYDEARRLIEQSGPLPEGFGLMKLAATVLSYVSGLPGGIFAPSLAVGAGLGDGVARLFDLPLAATVILGMAAYFTGVVQVPITAVVIVMEMTDNHDLILPLMASSFIAFAVSRAVCPKPLYRSLAQGFLLRAGRREPRPPTPPEPTP